MIGAFNSVYTALQGFFSRSFWFAGFLPVAVFAGVHVLIAEYVYDTVTFLGFKVSFDETVADGAISGVVVLVILVILAYALTPLLPLFRGLLDGSLLPPRLHDALRTHRLAQARRVQAAIEATLDQLGAIDMVNDSLKVGGTFDLAYKAALRLDTATATNEVTAARKSLQKLSDLLLSSRSAQHSILKDATLKAKHDVVEALSKNNPDPDELTEIRKRKGGPEVLREELNNAAATNLIAEDFKSWVDQARREALYRYQILKTRNRVVDATESPRATLVGEARFVTERYARDVYQVDFDFLWPRLLVAMRTKKSDDPLLEAIEMARSKVDFAVLSLALATSIPLVWLPLIIYTKGSPWLFLTIGAATPPVLGFFYHLVFEGQLAFGEVVKTAIDGSRFLVLRMLRQAEPASRSEERELWTRITIAQTDARRADLFYIRSSDEAAGS